MLSLYLQAFALLSGLQLSVLNVTVAAPDLVSLNAVSSALTDSTVVPPNLSLTAVRIT